MIELGRSGYKAIVMDNAQKTNRIRYVSFELLDFCNYKCPHCYVRNTYNAIMDSNVFYRLIDELYLIGCTWILLTGGEPLLHPHFIQMYQYAYQKGFIVTVFTNGYNITEDILNTFADYPPELLEISIYGGTHQTYDHFVGVKGAFDLVERNIDRLLIRGVNVKLKTVLMNEIIPEMSNIMSYAKKKSLSLRYDGFIIPRINGITIPCEYYRANPKEVLKYDVQKIGFINAMKDKARQHKEDCRLYTCGAAHNSVFFDALSRMCICTFARHIYVDMKDKNITIAMAQNQLLKILANKMELTEKNECYKCSKRPFCRYCPGQFMLENNSEYIPTKWHCQYALYVERLLKSDEEIK